LLEQKFSKSQKKWDEYLVVCERLGKEPDYNKLPMNEGSFPYEVQLAFFIHSLLPDRWDGMSGSYMGKDWSALGTLLDIHDIEYKKTVIFFLKYIDIYASNQINEEMDAKRKQAERKTPQGIKTHA
tara:strand:- start:663 stop:1040 length:378 start_codon:yes stop_codon:yes gene_type:complete